MFDEALPDDVQGLLRAHIESHEHLAILLLAQRDQGRNWSESQLSDTLAIPAQLVEAAVAGLGKAGVLQALPNSQPRCFKFAATGAIADTCSRLAAVYAENPLLVVRFMNT